jgi:hypothetical protein
MPVAMRMTCAGANLLQCGNINRPTLSRLA